MGVFEGLKPEAVWGYFEEICQVPRPSKKEGKIIANNERLEDIFRQLSRWYDVKFEYEEEGLKDLIFSGKMKKYDNGNVILGILKATGKIDFIQQDSVIHVKRQLKQRL